ncbi:MAG: FAD-binding oxidoreductase, partial [Cytophagaceae bacterium]
MSNKVTGVHLFDELCKIVGSEYVFLDKETLFQYSHDETEDLSYLPEIVVKPGSAEEIGRILIFCNHEKIPVTPRGAGTGLSGGALPVCGGVLLSMERFNEIIEIDEKNFQATVESGVITEVFQDAVKRKGLYYPPDPSSRGSCFLGGNLAESSGGPRAVKYGITRDYVLNLEVVLPTGEIVWTGANVLKNSTGYNLTQLMIGSEGTLGIITKIVFKLIPHPDQDLVLLVPFKRIEDACEAVSAIFKAGITPSALEFMEKDAILWSAQYLNLPMPVLDDIEAHLLIEVDGNDLNVLYTEIEKVFSVVDAYNIGEPLLGENSRQKEGLWKLRRNVAHAVKVNSIYKEEDTVVPRGSLPQLIKGVKEIGERYGFKSVCYGHAGDGNLHINIIKGELSKEQWEVNVTEGIKDIFKLCVALKGTISG